MRNRHGAPLHRHFCRHALRGGRHRLPAVPRLEIPRGVRCVGSDVRGPLRRPARPDPLPQLGLGPTPGRARGRWNRRRGVVQIFVNRLDDALAEVSWAAEHVDLFGGILLPSIPPGSHLPGLYDPVYDPLWRLCEQVGAVVNVHAGSGLPDYGDLEIARAVMLVELPWFSHRPLWHLIFGGVFDRFPNLKVALTEQGVAWLPRGLETLDWFYGRMAGGSAAEAMFFGAAAQGMSMKPSEYFARNVWVGASFLRSSESALRPGFGADRIMWGDDYPHSEGTWPFSREALRVAFAGEDPN